VRANPFPDAALFRTAGRGMAMPNAGPGAEYWRPVAYGVKTEAEARAALRELAAKKVDLVKIWGDDRNGTVQKLTPPLYRAIIDEAHTISGSPPISLFGGCQEKSLHSPCGSKYISYSHRVATVIY
jgi:hypothetical protein